MRPDAATRTAPVRFAAMTLPIAGLLLMSVQPSAAQDARNTAANAGNVCAGDNGGITLSPGFCATVFADNVGHARHMVVAPNGVVYVNTWSGRYYANTENAKAPDGGFLLALQDTTGSGRADKIVRFGPGVESGNAGGTGIALYNGALFAETNDRIVRYALPPGAIAPTGAPEVVVSGLPLPATIPCIRSRSMRRAPCTSTSARPPMPASGRTEFRILRASSRARSSRRGPASGAMTPTAPASSSLPPSASPPGCATAKASHSTPPAGYSRPSTGGTSCARTGARSTPRSRAPNEPAEELVQLERGADFGWPYCYFDLSQQKLVLAPEYGGDGGKAIGPCAGKRAPVAAFPAHWAPNDLAIYDGQQFPAPYRGGAFIAFHGSWNRAPSPQGGYNVVFQPLADGKASGNYVVFADGFAGASKEPGRAAHRPSGLAVGPDGALYVSDDQRGRIWRIVFRGGTAVTAIAPAPAPAGGSASTAAAGPPEGVHPDAGSQIAALPVPAGATPADVALGSRIYGAGTCAGCHGSDAKGTPLGPDLTGAKWLWGDGSVQSIAKIITDGVPNPKEFRSPMPPMGGTQLSASEVSAVADYIWALGHGSGASTGQAR